MFQTYTSGDAQKNNNHDDGIYFDMPHAEYLADAALGSSDLKLLSYDPLTYWFSSHMNPLREQRSETPSQALGAAFHTMVLDGPEEFRSRYLPEPGAEYMRLADEIAEWLKARGVKPPRLKGEMIEIAVRLDPEVKIADVYRQKAAAEGKTILSEADWSRIIQSARTLAANPALAGAVSGGEREVSIFWTEVVDGVSIRRKARFDYLKPRAIVDLKSIRPTFGRSFSDECLRAIANWRYDIQAAAYMQARTQMGRLLDAGAVHGEHDPEWLRVVATNEEYAFVIAFWASEGAPLTWAGTLSIGNPILELAAIDIANALATYARCLKRYGSEPWFEFSPLNEIFMESLPAWFGR